MSQFNPSWFCTTLALAMEGGNTTSELWWCPEPIRNHDLAPTYSRFQPKMAHGAQALIRKSCFTMKCYCRTTGGFCQEEFTFFPSTKLKQKNVWFLLLVKGAGFALTKEARNRETSWGELISLSDQVLQYPESLHFHITGTKTSITFLFFFFFKDFTLALATKLSASACKSEYPI